MKAGTIKDLHCSRYLKILSNYDRLKAHAIVKEFSNMALNINPECTYIFTITYTMNTYLLILRASFHAKYLYNRCAESYLSDGNKWIRRLTREMILTAC